MNATHRSVRRAQTCLTLSPALCRSVGTSLAAPSGAPRAGIHPITDDYRGISVKDPYRWRENGADAKVRAGRAGRPIRSSLSERAGHGIGSARPIRVNQRAGHLASRFDRLCMQAAK